MAVVLPLNEMTVEEKLQVMEAIWDDLLRSPQDVPAPAWHKDVLEERERDIQEGRAKFIPLEEFRRIIEEKTR